MGWLYCRLLSEVRSCCWSWGDIGREGWCLSLGLEREIGTVFELGVVSEMGQVMRCSAGVGGCDRR